MTTINVRELTFDTRAFGNKFILTDVNPVYEYVDGQRTSNITGYRYTVTLPQCGYAMLDVKIAGEQQIERKVGETMPVVIDDLTVRPYVNYRNHNALAVTATAAGIRRG